MSRHFVQAPERIEERNPWTLNHWLCRPNVVDAEKLLLVRAHMEPGCCHPFHFHPHREEIIYVVEGTAEQWVGDDFRLLKAGEIAHIPAGTVHGTYNPHDERLVFLAILSPAKLTDPPQAQAEDPHDVGTQEPWASLRKSRGLKECAWGESGELRA